MTSFNRQDYISDAIKSVLNQTYKNFELILSDDCSYDKTVQIIEKYVRLDSRVKLFINKVNLGDYPNRNIVASYALGEYLIYVDSDDMIMPDALEYINSVIESNVIIDFALIDDRKTKNFSIIDSREIIHNHFFKKSILHLGPGGSVVRREFFLKNAGFRDIYGPASDMYYNIRNASITKVILLHYNYVFYRIHNGQEINNKFSYLYNGYNYFNDILNFPSLPLTNVEKKYLSKKNKRRLFVNLFKYLIVEKDIPKVIKVCKLTKVTLKDLLVAIFQ